MRKILAGLVSLLLAGPVLGQALPAIPPVPDADRTVTYNVTYSTQTFPVPFPVYGDCSDIQVAIGAVVQNPATYACVSASGRALPTITRPVTDLNIVLVNPLLTGTLVVTGAYHARNLIVPTAPGITRREFEQTINTILSGMRESSAGLLAVTPPTLYGIWSSTAFYPVNSVVTYQGAAYEAAQPNIGQTPAPGSAYWQSATSDLAISQAAAVASANAAAMAANTVFVATSSSGGGAAIVVGSTFPSAFALRAGNRLTATATFSVVGATNLSVDGLSSLPIMKQSGTGLAALAGGEIVSGQQFEVLYDGAVFELLNPVPPILPPSGAVMAFNLASCPMGWISSNGTNGTADVRGVTIRGLDSGRGLDPGRALASYQADQIQSFTATYAYPNSAVPTSGTGGGFALQAGVPLANAAAALSGANFGSETRGKNVALLYCQKS